MAAPAFDHARFDRFAPVQSLSPVTAALVAFAGTVATWEMRAKTRAALREVPRERLPDLGLTTAEVLREVEKSFWQA